MILNPPLFSIGLWFMLMGSHELDKALSMGIILGITGALAVMLSIGTSSNQ